MELTLEIWRHVSEQDVIHLKHDRFDTEVTSARGRPGYHPVLFRELSDLLEESGEPPGGRRQQGEGRRARRSEDLGSGPPEEP